MFGFLKAPRLITLTAGEAKARADQGEIQLVDVREAHEWAAGHIAGALHAPLSTLADHAATLPRDQSLVFYCQAGTRSAKAIELCRRLGLPHDHHVDGGITAWQAAGLPVVR